jgi:hypothetical protein
MGQLTFQAALGGAVNLAGPNTASTTTFTLPSADGSNGVPLVTNGSGTLSLTALSLTAGVSGILPAANGGTGNANGAVNKLATTNFTIEESGGKLVFKYGATTIASMTSAGVFTTLSNVTGNGTP